MLLMLQVADPLRAVTGRSGWNARCEEMMSKISRLIGLNSATEQVGVLDPMVMLLQQKVLLSPDLSCHIASAS
jgi:hypothetical protein